MVNKSVVGGGFRPKNPPDEKKYTDQTQPQYITSALQVDPNGDGENDLFQPFIEEGAAEIMMFKVYNRWGTLVHDDIAPWDGNYQGKPHPAEVLIYMIQFNTNDGVVNESGQITLAR